MILYKINKNLETTYTEIVAIGNRLIEVKGVVGGNSKLTTKYIVGEELQKIEQTSLLGYCDKLLKPKNIILIKNNHSLEENIDLIVQKKFFKKIKEGWVEDIEEARQLKNSEGLFK